MIILFSTLFIVAVVTKPGRKCITYEPLKVTTESGYLSSAVTLETTLGGPECPWKIQVKFDTICEQEIFCYWDICDNIRVILLY